MKGGGVGEEKERREVPLPSPFLPSTHDPLAMEGNATVDKFLFSARVRQFLTAFSRLGTASLSDHCGLCTCSTCLQGKVSPEPLIAAGKG